MATLDDSNEVCPGGRVIIETTVTDAATGLAPIPLPSVTCHIFQPDSTGATDYVEAAAEVMTGDGAGTYSLSYLVPVDGPSGAWLTQVEMNFSSYSDISLRSATFWVVD